MCIGGDTCKLWSYMVHQVAAHISCNMNIKFMYQQMAAPVNYEDIYMRIGGDTCKL